MNCVSSPFNGFSKAYIDGYAGNVIASIPSLIGLSSSVISFVVAFCVSVIGLKNFERSVCNSNSPVLSLSRLSRIFFLRSRYSFTIKSLLAGSLIFKMTSLFYYEFRVRNSHIFTRKMQAKIGKCKLKF